MVPSQPTNFKYLKAFYNFPQAPPFYLFLENGPQHRVFYRVNSGNQSHAVRVSMTYGQINAVHDFKHASPRAI